MNSVEIPIFTWDRCDAHLPFIRASRHRLQDQEHVDWHGHAYHEWTWVARGEVLHTCPERGEEHLVTGDLRMMPPGRHHHMRALGQTVITTASVEPQLFRTWSASQDGEPWWPWRNEVCAIHLAPNALRRLETALDELPGAGQQAVDAGWFLLTLCRVVRSAGASDLPAEDHCPPWLQQVIDGFSGLQALHGGGRELVRRTGRHPTYVARLIRRHHGCSLRDLVNMMRIRAAAHALRHSDKNVTEIAVDVGIANQGQFHRLFKAAYGVTPRTYRHAALVPMGFFRRSRPD